MTVSHFWRELGERARRPGGYGGAGSLAVRWVTGGRPPGEKEPRGARRLLIDLSPLRRSRDLRHLVWGELVSVLGNQLTTVAVPYQVYQLTHSSLVVGLVSVTQ